MGLEETVQAYMFRHGLIREGSHIVAGISGGADSVCLLRLLCGLREQQKIHVTAVHVQHGIRREEAWEDAEFVRQLCELWEVPFRLFSYNVPQMAREQGCSLEEMGRKVRYKALLEAAREAEAESAAVAHNMDDQAETMLLNLARGTGLAGMAGMPPRRKLGDVYLIRPLLCVPRSEIEGYLARNGQSYRTDSTNLEDAYTRNKIRHRILPQMGEINAKAASHLAQACEAAREVQEYMQQQAVGILEKAVEWGGQVREQKLYSGKSAAKDGAGRLALSVDVLQNEPVIMRKYVLREGLRRLLGTGGNIGQIHIEALLELTAGASGRQISLPGRLTAYRDYGTLLLCREEEAHLREMDHERMAIRCSLTVPGEYVLENGVRIRLELEEWKKEQNIPIKRYTKWLDYDRIEDSLELRTRLPGDYLVVDGSGGRKKLKDYFIDEKVDRAARERMLLLADGSHILWAIGMRISEDCKITYKTKRVVKIQVDGGYYDGRENSGADPGGRAAEENTRDGQADQ